LALIAGASMVAQAQTPAATSDSAFIRDNYTKREVMIPMRDGVRLFTTIYTPKDGSKKYPIILRRTPYSCSPYGAEQYVQGFQNMTMARAGYIHVFQDVRGRYMSEGDFVDVRPYTPAADPSPKGKKQTDEATDTYDTVDWLLRYAEGNNGRVGVMGISYPGFYSTMAVLAGHPAIKAVSPQAPVTDWFIGDDFHHNGAFFLLDAFSFYSGFGKPRPQPTTRGAEGFRDWNTPDNYDFYLKVGALRNFNERYLKGGIPFWNELMQHPDYDAWWQARNPRPHLKNVMPAVMTVGGLFDAEDCWGAWNTYKALENQNPASHSNRIVMGPWVHGGWARGKGDRLGSVVFGQPTSEFYQKQIEFKFFEHYLRGEGQMDLPEAYIFETGSNRWTTYAAWPPKEVRNEKYFFNSGGRLSQQQMLNSNAPNTSWAKSDYTSDPAKPVPYAEDVHLHRTREYMCDDQRFAARRPDVLVYETQPLTEPLTVTGTVIADLWASLSTTDADFVVKLIDVFPDTLKTVERDVPMGGYQMLVRGEIFRGRYRNSFERPEAFQPGVPAQVKFELPDVAHTFLPGHQVMVQVQSTWFPLVDRNPQQFINIYEAKDEDFVPCDISIWHNAAHASGVVLPVLKK
ncbi:MAG TPA: CocE/NonD family hydrolase, partial [Saprospiraceae bacterium]|nr:CocE/NonD family hydrolase [Saprospiraceae bacterium]